jgi:protein gp37
LTSSEYLTQYVASGGTPKINPRIGKTDDMAETSLIEWTDSTWNPVTGCTKVSRGCDNCYAERLSERFRGIKGHPYEQGFDLRLWPNRVSLPLTWKRPRLIFVNSMSDLFHKDIPKPFVSEVFDTMERADWHIFQVLTKRSSRLRGFVNERYSLAPTPCHIWLGVSIEDTTVLARIEHLRHTNATVRFLSIEPLLEPMGKLDLSGIHWVIVGGESGPNCRPIRIEWVREIRDQCLEAGIPFFFKQWGGIRANSRGNQLEGRIWQQYPSLPSRSGRVAQSLFPSFA